MVAAPNLSQRVLNSAQCPHLLYNSHFCLLSLPANLACFEEKSREPLYFLIQIPSLNYASFSLAAIRRCYISTPWPPLWKIYSMSFACSSS